MTKLSLSGVVLSLLYLVINGSIYNGVQLSSFASGPSDGIKISTGATTDDQLGFSVSSAGDFNNDGLADVVIGVRSATYDIRSNAGLVLVLFGHNDSTLDVDINLNTFVTGPRGFKIFGPTSNAYLGSAVAGVGDVNGDKIDDILIGAPGESSSYGNAYVIYGRSGSPMKPFVNIDLHEFSSSAVGLKITGPSAAGQFGFSVAGAGDFNKDGIKDIIIGAPYYSSSQGRAYVLMGAASLPATVSVGDLGKSNSVMKGFYVQGATTLDFFGYSVSTAGDINGDEKADIIIGAAQQSPINVVILFGYDTARSFGNVMLTSSSSLPDGVNGIAVVGGGGADTAYFAVSGGTDLNGDNITDILIGASGYNPPGRSNAGRTCVLYGYPTAINSGQFSLSSAIASETGFCVSGGKSGDLSGTAVNSVGDINGDGIGDFIIGAPGVNLITRKYDYGTAYVIFGRQGNTNPDFTLSDFTSGFARGFTIEGSSANEKFGSKAISGAGDFNGDGIDDIIVGSSDAEDGAGIVCIIYGERSSSMPTKMPTGKPTAKPTLSPTFNPSKAPTFAPTTQAPTRSPTVTPSIAPTAKPSITPSVRPSVDPTAKPSNVPTAVPSVVPTVGPTGNPTVSPSTATPSVSPTTQPSKGPTVGPSINPSLVPTANPTAPPSVHPTENPTRLPTVSPTAAPSLTPTVTPTAKPSKVPTAGPSAPPSTISPTAAPTKGPTANPSFGPTRSPDISATDAPSRGPTISPTASPSTSSPTNAPTKLPTADPTAAPSQGPTNRPTAAPSLSPSVRPTTNPTRAPTISPTTTPSQGPTISPTTAPSTVSPSAAPSMDPTISATGTPSQGPTRGPAPSAQPTRRPTMTPPPSHILPPATGGPNAEPTASPTVVSSVQPSSASPSVAPSAAPSVAMSDSPSSVLTHANTSSPTAIPTADPSVESSIVPTARPSAEPTFGPSEHLTVDDPTVDPTTAPSLHSTDSPSVAPSPDPSAFPSADPTVDPSLVPTMSPTVAPTSTSTAEPSLEPSRTPTVLPSTAPSTVPTTAPSAFPSVAPSVIPSVAPTASPSVRPSASPSVPPSRAPTAGPSVEPGQTAGPSRAPTIAPSLSNAEMWRAELSEALSTAAARQPVDEVYRSIFYELNVGSSALYGSCSGWQSFVSSELIPSSLLYKPTSIELVSQQLLSLDPAFVRCDNSSSVKEILRAVKNPTAVQTAFQCGLHKWVVSTCGATTSSAAVCVDCVDPCASQCASDDMEITSPYSIAPCATTSCAGGSAVTSAVRILTVAYQDRSPASVILKLDTVQTKSAITVSVELSDSGSVYCAAYLLNVAGESYVPTSVSSVVMPNFVASTDDRNISTVVIRNLQAASNYAVYCAAQSSAGTWMSLSKVKETVREVHTECCNTIDLQTAASSVTEASAVRDFLSIVVPVRPVTSAQLLVSLVDSTGKVLSPSPFVPSSFALSAQQSVTAIASQGTAGVTFTASLQPLPAGTYTYNVTLVSATSAHYDFNFGTSNSLVVLELNKPLPAPVLTSAALAADGSYVAVVFDANTDRGGVATTFACTTLLEFACASTSTCVWASAREVHAFVSSAADCAVVDSPMSLSATAVIKAQCQSTSGSCDTTNWPTANKSTVVSIAAPSAGSAVSPTVVIKAPSSIGACDSLTLDVTASSGNGGRAWLTPSITVESSPGTNVTELQHFLSAVYKMSPPTAISASLLNPDSTYNFVVKLCNFLGQCGTASKRVLVQSSAIPSVSFEGNAFRPVQCSSLLTIASDASYTNCDNVVTRSGLSFEWTVSQGGAQLLSLPSQSRDPTKLVIAANTLTTNTLYDVRLQVTKQDSGKANAASMQVFVQAGAVRAIVAMGVSRSVRVGQSLRIDARDSFDEDVTGATGAAAGLSFTWTCAQVAPVLSDSCSTVLSQDIANSVDGVYIAQTSLSATDAVVQVKLLVQDASRSRSAEKVITVTVLPALAPVATLTANVASSGVFNSNQELQLTGTVGFPVALNGSVTWSVDDTSAFSLASSAKSPLTVAFGASIAAQSNTVYMVIAANALPGRTSLTFSLTASLAGSSQATVAAVTVLVNAAPLPGKFFVTPLSGMEITEMFTFSASEWFDDNLPLQYQFGQVAMSGLDTTLRSKKESAFGTTALTAGAQAVNYSVTCVVHVFDSHSASTRATFPVVVRKLVLDSANSLSDLISDGLSDSAADSDGLKQATSMGSYLLNEVDCSAAPDCAVLNRHGCFRSQNTCGECLSSAYVGDAGDSNEKCIPASSLLAGRTSRSLLAGSADQSRSCNAQDECGVFETCSVGVCAPQPKQCTGNCSYPLGQCQYVHADSGDTVPNCYVGATDCLAVCKCVEDFESSATCSLNSTELGQKQSLRAQVIRGIASLVALENPDQQVVEGWISSIVASAQVPDELTSASSTELLRLAQTVLTTASQVGMSMDSLASLLKVIDSVSQAVKDVDQRRRLYSTDRTSRILSMDAEDNTTLSHVETTLTQFKDIVLTNILPGQDAVTATLPQFRLYVVKLAATSSGGDVAISLPQTALEAFNDQGQSSVSLPRSANGSSQDAVGVALVSMRAELLNAARGLAGAHQAFSNPLTVQWRDTACTGPSCRFEVVLQTTFALHDSLLTPEVPAVFNTTCAQGDLSTHQHLCPDGSMLTVDCPGDAVKIISRCNVTKRVPSCGGVSAYAFAETGCQVKSRTSTSITCSCPLAALSGRHRAQTNSEDDGAPETSVSYVAMLSEVQQSFVDTVVSAQGLNASTVEKGWSALVTVGSLAAALLFGLYWAHNADQEIRKTKPDKKELITGSSSGKEVDKDSFLARWVFPPPAPDRRRARKLNKKRVIDKDVQIAEQALPAILRSNQLSHRVTDEIKHHHKYIGIIFFFSSSFPRTLRVLSLAMNVITMLFMQSLTYSLTNPDDGLCETYQSPTECLDPRSPYATGESKCYWTPEISACALAEPDSSMKVILFVAIFSALMSTPIALAVDWVILSILAAPTQQTKTTNTVSIETTAGSPTHRGTRAGRRTGIAPTLPASVSSEQQTRAASVTSLVASPPSSSKRISSVLGVGSWRGSTVGIDFDEQSQVTTINASAQNDLRALVAGLNKYRHELTPSERIEFDLTWGLDENGSFLTDEESMETWCAYLSAQLSPSSGTGSGSVSQRVLMDLRHVHSCVLRETAVASAQEKSNAEKGRRLLYLFQRDLLPGISGKILESKGQRDNLTTQSVAWSTKLAAWVGLMLLNIGMLFYILLFALSQTTHRQSAWALSFLLWLVVDVLLVSSSIVIFTHILVPSLIMKDVSKIKQKLVDSIRDFNAGVQSRRHLVGSDSEDEEEEFNAASYLFVSTRLAKEWADLREAKIIAQFRTPWPKQSYQRDVNVSASYSKRYTALYRSASVIAVFFLTQLVQVPPGLQDMVIQMVTTTALGYTILLHIDLYLVFPLLALLPVLLVAVVLHFFIRSRRAAAQQELSKVLAAPKPLTLRRETLRHLGDRTRSHEDEPKGPAGIVLGDALYDHDIVASYNAELQDTAFTSREQQWLQTAQPADEEEEEEGKRSMLAVPSLHTTRRQSVQHGIRVMDRLRLETQQSLTSVPEGSSGEEDATPLHAAGHVLPFQTHFEGSSERTDDTPLHTPLPSARQSHIDKDRSFGAIHEDIQFDFDSSDSSSDDGEDSASDYDAWEKESEGEKESDYWSEGEEGDEETYSGSEDESLDGGVGGCEEKAVGQREAIESPLNSESESGNESEREQDGTSDSDYLSEMRDGEALGLSKPSVAAVPSDAETLYVVSEDTMYESDDLLSEESKT